MIAALFEIRLFNDDLPALFRAQGEMLRQNATYLRLSLVPMLWMIVPIGLIVAQLEFQYGYTGLTPGQPALVKAHLRQASASAPAPAAALEVPRGIRVLTSAAWFPATQEIIWRVTPDAPGRVRAQRGDRWREVYENRRCDRACCSAVAGPRRRRVPESAAVSSRTSVTRRRSRDLDQCRLSVTRDSGSAMGRALGDCLSPAFDGVRGGSSQTVRRHLLMDLTVLQRLEAESIHIMREVVAECERPVMLYSIGKDSSVMLHLAMKAFYPGEAAVPAAARRHHLEIPRDDRVPRRDREALGLDLLVHINDDGLEMGINPFTHGRRFTPT